MGLWQRNTRSDKCHVFPFPAARVAGLAGGKEASHLDHLSTTLLYLAREQVQELAQRGIRERTGEMSVFEQPFEIEIFDANDPIQSASRVVSLWSTSSRRQVMRECRRATCLRAFSRFFDPCDRRCSRLFACRNFLSAVLRKAWFSYPSPYSTLPGDSAPHRCRLLLASSPGWRQEFRPEWRHTTTPPFS